MTEVKVTDSFNEIELWKTIEYIPKHEAELVAKFQKMLDRVRPSPKVYGNGLSLKEVDNG